MRAGREAERETFLAGVIHRAVEFGIEHWAEVLELTWWPPTPPAPLAGPRPPAPHGGAPARALILVTDANGYPVPGHDPIELTPVLLNRAFKVLFRNGWRNDPRVTDTPFGPGVRPTEAWSRRMLDHRQRNDASDLDGLDASMLVQLGLWGAIVF